MDLEGTPASHGCHQAAPPRLSVPGTTQQPADPPAGPLEAAPGAAEWCPRFRLETVNVSTRDGGRHPGSAPRGGHRPRHLSASAASPAVCTDTRGAWRWPQGQHGVLCLAHTQKTAVNTSPVAWRCDGQPRREDRTECVRSRTPVTARLQNGQRGQGAFLEKAPRTSRIIRWTWKQQAVGRQRSWGQRALLGPLGGLEPVGHLPELPGE